MSSRDLPVLAKAGITGMTFLFLVMGKTFTVIASEATCPL